MAKATNFITQTAARRLRAALKRAEKRIDQLQRDREQLFSRWGGDVPGGTHIRSINLSCSDAAVIASKPRACLAMPLSSLNEMASCRSWPSIRKGDDAAGIAKTQSHRIRSPHTSKSAAPAGVAGNPTG